MSEETAQTEPKKDCGNKHRCCISGWIAGFIFIAALMVGFYWKFDSLQNRLNQYTLNQTSTINNIQSRLDQVQKNMTLNQADWSLIQAKRLIALASVSLTYQHDLPTAIGLLTTANELLTKTNSIAYTALQKEISDRIATLSAFKIPDINASYLQIQTLDQHIDNISFAPEPATQPSETETTAPTSKWNHFWQKVWGKLNHVLIIQHHEEAITSLFSIKDQALLRGYLHLLTAQMQTALLQNNKTIFDAALTQFNTALTHCAELNPTATQPLLDIITQLQNIVWDQTWPNLTTLIQLANQP